jgi:hypothetical protein
MRKYLVGSLAELDTQQLMRRILVDGGILLALVACSSWLVGQAGGRRRVVQRAGVHAATGAASKTIRFQITRPPYQ